MTMTINNTPITEGLQSSMTSSLLSGCIKERETLPPSRSQITLATIDDDVSISSTSSSSSSSSCSSSPIETMIPEVIIDDKKSKKPRVKFTNVEMRIYDRILGDNPACTDGPPISLDWKYSDKVFSTSLDEYETHRLPRRTRRQLTMSTVTRRNMMFYHFGYSHEKITEAANSVKKIQKQRAKTKSLTTNQENRQKIAESFKRKLKKTLGFEKSIEYERRINRHIEARENDQINNLMTMVR